jgi:hypothetical protein
LKLLSHFGWPSRAGLGPWSIPINVSGLIISGANFGGLVRMGTLQVDSANMETFRFICFSFLLHIFFVIPSFEKGIR